MNSTPAIFARKLADWLGSRCRWLFGKWSTHSADIVKGGIGALIGALLAFHVERYSRDEETSAENLEAGLLVLATLESMEETLFANYCVHVLPHLDSARPWLSLGAGPAEFQTSPERLNAASLSFLLPSGGLQIYKEISAAQEAYLAYTALVSRRNRLLWDVIYPVTDPLMHQVMSTEDFNRKVADQIGAGEIEQAHQGALQMLATQHDMLVIGEAKSAVHRAMTDLFDDGDVPPLPPELWPKDRETPDCSLVERQGYNSMVRRSKASVKPAH